MGKFFIDHEERGRDVVFLLVSVSILLGFLGGTSLMARNFDVAGGCACGIAVTLAMLKLIDNAKDAAEKAKKQKGKSVL